MASDRSSLKALRNLIAEADVILETAPALPENRTGAARENLKAALALADDLLKYARSNAATTLGSKGGNATSRKLGKEHYQRMAAARKTHSGGRPRKQAE